MNSEERMVNILKQLEEDKLMKDRYLQLSKDILGCWPQQGTLTIQTRWGSDKLLNTLRNRLPYTDESILLKIVSDLLSEKSDG